MKRYLVKTFLKKYLDAEKNLEKMREHYINLINLKNRNYLFLNKLKLSIDRVNESLLTLTDHKFYLIKKIEENTKCHIQELDLSINQMKSLPDENENIRNKNLTITENNLNKIMKRTEKLFSGEVNFLFKII